jgi:hypothetical protein
MTNSLSVLGAVAGLAVAAAAADTPVPNAYTQTELDNIFRSADIAIKPYYTTLEVALTDEEISKGAKQRPGKRTCLCDIFHAKTGDKLHQVEATDRKGAEQKAAQWVVTTRGGKARTVTRDQQIDQTQAEQQKQLDAANAKIANMQERLDNLLAAREPAPAPKPAGAPVAEPEADEAKVEAKRDPVAELKSLTFTELKAKAVEVGVTGVNVSNIGKDNLIKLIVEKQSK